RRATGPVTINHYITAIKGFAKWPHVNNRTSEDRLRGLERWNEEVDRRHRRRSLPQGVFEKLLKAAAEGCPFRGLSGTDRFFLYIFAAHTGLRASELASLTPESFELHGPTPTCTVAAAYSKHRQEDVQPIREDIARLMGRFLEGKQARTA